MQNFATFMSSLIMFISSMCKYYIAFDTSVYLDLSLLNVDFQVCWEGLGFCLFFFSLAIYHSMISLQVLFYSNQNFHGMEIVGPWKLFFFLYYFM